MVVKILLCLFFVAATAAFGQTSVKAGDPAPEIDWSKIVGRPETAKFQPTLTGQYTVLAFLPVTPNAKAIVRWNDLTGAFAGQPVQFVWITSEPWSVIEPFLREHPMNGWLIADEKVTIAHAYEGENGGDVIVDPSGRIAGFTPFLQAEQLSGVLAGNAVAIAREAEDDDVRRLMANGKVRLNSEPERFDPPSMPDKPNIPPSYEVHISPSKTKGTVGSAGPDFWAQRGFGLKEIVAMVYEKDLSRVILPPALDNSDKFDFVVVLPNAEDQPAIYQLVQGAIEKRFRISAIVDSKPAEVYVMTAVKGKTPRAKKESESFGGGFASSSSSQFSLPEGTAPTPEAIEKAMQELMKSPEKTVISNLSADNTTMNEFSKFLERSLNRPIIDETGLEGVYDLEVSGDAKTADEFMRALREQTGLVLTPATRSIEFLTLRSLN